MKAYRIFATAALMLASLGISTAASAQVYGNDRHYDSRVDRERGDNHRRYDGDRRHNDYRNYDRRGDRRWQRNHGWRNDRRCWTEWRHHRQVRICR
ncbi:hypothetical protein BH09PSE3_BH09PSE3_14370 [soil metagenome]